MATTPKDTSLSSAFKYAFDQPLENMATTFQALGMEGWEEYLRDIVETPENYESATEKFINSQSPEWWDVNWEYFPRATFEQAGQIAGSIATRIGAGALGGMAGPKGALAGALIGPALFEAIQIAGPVALERAKRNGREEPNWDDWKGALSTSAFSGALNAFGIRGVGTLNSTVKQVGKAAAMEGGTEGVQGLAQQVGSTVLTDEGLEIDPKSIYAEALLGSGAGGGTQAITGSISAVKDAIKPTDMPPQQPSPEVEVEPEPEPEPEVKEVKKVKKVKEVTPTQLMDDLYSTLEEDVKDTPTLRKYLNPVIIKNSLIYEGEVYNKEYEDLAKAIDQEFENKNTPQEVREKVLRETLDTIKAEQEIYTNERMLGPAYGQDRSVYGPAPIDRIKKPFFKKGMILENLVRPKIDKLQAEDEPAVEMTNLFEVDENTRPIYNAPQFIMSKPDSGYVASDILPLGQNTREYTDEAIEFLKGRENARGYYPNKIDPKTMSYSVLRRHLTLLDKQGGSRKGVQGINPKKPGDPEKMFKALFLKKNRNGFPIPKEDLSPKNKKIALQAVSSGVAQRLLDLQQQGKGATVAELDQILDDYYSRFQHVHLTDENKTFIDSQEWVDPKDSEKTRFRGIEGLLNAPLDPVDNRWDNVEQTLHSGIQLEDYARQYSIGFPDNTKREEGGNYFEAKESVIGSGINDEIWYSFNPKLDSNAEFAAGLDLQVRRQNPRHYDDSISQHSVLPGTYGWTRGIMGEFGPIEPDGPVLFGKMIGEIQQDIYRQGSEKGPERFREKRFRSLAGKEQLTETEKLIQNKIDEVYSAIKLYNNRNELARKKERLDLVRYVNPIEVYAPLAELKRDQGPQGQRDTESEFPIDTVKFPRYVFKHPLPIRPWQSGLIEGLTTSTERDYSFNERSRNSYFDQLGETDVGRNVRPGGYFISKNRLRQLALKDEKGYSASAVANDAFWYLKDFLKKAQPFKGQGILLDHEQIKDIIRATEDSLESYNQRVSSLNKLYISQWKIPFDSIFSADELNDSEVQEAIENVKSILPFIEHVSLNASAPIILREAKPWALETMQEVPELAPFVETTVNRPSYLKNQKEIDDFVVAEQQAEVESSDIIPDYPHQGTSQGQEGEFAKDILQREIVEMLRTYPDANAIGLHRWGTEGSPQSPYVAMIKEARKIADENPLIDFKKIAEFPIRRTVKENKERVTKEVMQEIYVLDLTKFKELFSENFEGDPMNIQFFFEGMQKGGLVKATNQTINLGDYGRRFI